MMDYPPPPALLSQPPPQYQDPVEVQSVKKSQLCNVKWIKVVAFMVDFILLCVNIYFVIIMTDTRRRDLGHEKFFLTFVSILAEVALFLAIIGDIVLCCFTIPPEDNGGKSKLCFWLVAQIIFLVLHLIQLTLAAMAVKVGVRDYTFVVAAFSLFEICFLPFRFWSIYSIATFKKWLMEGLFTLHQQPRSLGQFQQSSVEIQSVQKSQMLCSVKWIKICAALVDFGYLCVNVYFVYCLTKIPFNPINDWLTFMSVLAAFALIHAVVGDVMLFNFPIPPRNNAKAPTLRYWLIGQIVYLFLHIIQLVLIEIAMKSSQLYYSYREFNRYSDGVGGSRTESSSDLSDEPYQVAVAFAFIGICWLPFRFWSIYSVASYKEYLSANLLIPIVPPQQQYQMNVPAAGIMMNNRGTESRVHPSDAPPETVSDPDIQNNPVV